MLGNESGRKSNFYIDNLFKKWKNITYFKNNSLSKIEITELCVKIIYLIMIFM